jgi:FlaA1/EpsC-like NDP-sugar epimerase
MFKRTARYVLCDVSIIILSYFVGLLLDGFLSAEVTPTSFHYKSILIMTAVSAAVICLTYVIFRIYSVIWLYAGLKDITNVLIADIISVMLNLLAYIVLSGFYVINMNVYAFIFAQIFIVGLSLASRLIIKVAATYISYGEVIENQKKTALNNVMIIGAGDMGQTILKELEATAFALGKPVVFVDDDPMKAGRRIEGVPIKGGCDKIPELVKKWRHTYGK